MQFESIEALQSYLSSACVTQLVIENSPGISALPTLPESLLLLHVVNCPNLVELPDNLPPNLRFLQIDRCPWITKLPRTAPGLRRLRVLHCVRLTGSYLIPSGVEELWVIDQPSIPEPPHSLRVLWIDNCPQLERLPQLPDSLADLVVKNCPKLSCLPAIPSSIKHLVIGKCPNIKRLPTQLREGLRVQVDNHLRPMDPTAKLFWTGLIAMIIVFLPAIITAFAEKFTGQSFPVLCPLSVLGCVLTIPICIYILAKLR